MNGDSILLVEDDKEIRQGVEIFLRSQGYQVFQAENGLEGLKILEERPIDLAIVDVMMPVMDGITMTAKLREKYDFPVIFLSAKTEEVDRVKSLRLCWLTLVLNMLSLDIPKEEITSEKQAKTLTRKYLKLSNMALHQSCAVENLLSRENRASLWTGSVSRLKLVFRT